MKRKSSILPKLLCLVIVLLLLLAGGCKIKLKNPEGGSTIATLPVNTTAGADEPTDPVSPEDTTVTDPTPTEPTTPAPGSRAEAEAESLDKFFDINKCPKGPLEDMGDYSRQRQDIYDDDGNIIGEAFNYIYVIDQSNLETYIIYFGLDEQGREVIRHFYGDGTRRQTVYITYNKKTQAVERKETYMYDADGWWFGFEEEDSKGNKSRGAVYPGTDEYDPDPEHGFKTTYREDIVEGKKEYMNFRYYHYDKNGVFISGRDYNGKTDETRDVTKAPAEDPWRAHYLESFEAYHNE